MYPIVCQQLTGCKKSMTTYLRGGETSAVCTHYVEEYLMPSHPKTARPAPDTTDFLTVEELAARLRVCRATAWLLVQHGHVRTVKLGRRTLIPQADVAAIVATVAERGLPVLRRSRTDTTPAA